MTIFLFEILMIYLYFRTMCMNGLVTIDYTTSTVKQMQTRIMQTEDFFFHMLAGCYAENIQKLWKKDVVLIWLIY